MGQESCTDCFSPGNILKAGDGKCAKCAGLGHPPGITIEECDDCGGSGECSTCDGSGFVDN
jgi:hypothetical protein